MGLLWGNTNTTLLAAVAGTLLVGVLTVTGWRMSVRNRKRNIFALNPDSLVLEYNFPRYFLNLIDITTLNVLPKSFMPLPHDWVYNLGHKAYEILSRNVIEAQIAYARCNFGFINCRGKDYFFSIDPLFNIFYVADADMIKEIFMRRNDFPKPIEMYAILDIFGKNVVTTENKEWRRHRRISAPSFSEKNNMFVHQASIDLVHEMFASWNREFNDDPKVKGTVVNVNKTMMKLALWIISRAAFGQKLRWRNEDAQNNSAFESSNNLAGSHKLSFRQSLELVMENLKLRLAIPKFMYALPIPQLKKIQAAFEEFDAFMYEIIHDAKNQKEANLLVSLVKAAREDKDTSDDKESAYGLSEGEIVGNIFIFMFAGHETTANALTFALSFLAVNPDKQQRLYEEVQQVCGEKPPTYKQLQELVYATAIMNETLRMYPPVIDIPKTTNGQQNLGKLVIPDKTRIAVHVVGVHYNSKYWGPDPKVFRPERWFTSPECAKDALKASQFMQTYLESRDGASTDADEPTTSSKQTQSIFTYNKYAYIPFSEGVRSCLGKRFAIVEFLTVITLIIQKYTVNLPEGVDVEKMFETVDRITLQTVRPVNLIFRPRNKAGK